MPAWKRTIHGKFPLVRRLAVLALLLGLSAKAQTRDDYLYINPSSLVSSTRLSSMAGASVGLAENVESLPFNYAAVAHLWPFLKRRWDGDATLSLLFTPVSKMRDFDNDGRSANQGGRLEGQLGVIYQYRRFGLGVVLRTSNRNSCLDDACKDLLGTSEVLGGIVGGFSMLQEQLVLGFGINLASATLSHGTDAVAYNGGSGGLSALVRPIGQPWRIGASVFAGSSGAPSSPAPLDGRPVFKGIVTPTRFSLGASYRFGERADQYNLPSPTLRVPQPDSAELEALPEPDGLPRGRVLLTTQLDLVLPVKGATTIRSFLYGEPPSAAGAQVYLVPRVGSEWEVLDDRLRLRLGGWVEPNYVSGTNVRPHLTSGFEWRVVKLYFDWSVSSSVDLAPRFLAFSVSLGFWH